MNNEPIIAIVDAFSTGRLLAPRFKSQGYLCVHIQSTSKLPPIFEGSLCPDNFIENIIYDDETIKILSNYNIRAVIAGTESGVILADRLSEQLKILSNGTKYSLAKRDKHQMLEVLQAKGIAVAKHYKSSNLEELISWIKSNLKYPVVIKPCSSAGAEDVVFCYNDSDVKKIFNKL